MGLVHRLTPTLDGVAAPIGDGTPRRRSISIPAGEYTAPVWVETDAGVVVRADSLPLQTGLRAGSVQVHSTDPVAQPGAGQLTAGSISAVPASATSVSLSAAAATGGEEPYTYQWHGSDTQGFTPSGATELAGFTSLSETDAGLTEGAPRYYRLVVTDNLGSTATSGEVSATPSTVTADFSDGFEAGDFSHAESGFSWDASSVNVTVSSTNPYAGTYAADFDFPAELIGDDSTAEKRFYFPPGVKEFWLSFRFYKPANFDQQSDPNGPDNNKFLRFWGGSYGDNDPKGGASFNPASGGESLWYGQWTDEDSIFFGGQADRWENWNAGHPKGTWQLYQFHAKLSSADGVNDGSYRFAADGVVRFNRTDVEWFGKGTAGNTFTEGYLMGWANQSYLVPTTFNIDEVRIYLTDPGWAWEAGL